VTTTTYRHSAYQLQLLNTLLALIKGILGTYPGECPSSTDQQPFEAASLGHCWHSLGLLQIDCFWRPSRLPQHLQAAPSSFFTKSKRSIFYLKIVFEIETYKKFFKKRILLICIFQNPVLDLAF